MKNHLSIKLLIYTLITIFISCEKENIFINTSELANLRLFYQGVEQPASGNNFTILFPSESTQFYVDLKLKISPKANLYLGTSKSSATAIVFTGDSVTQTFNLSDPLSLTVVSESGKSIIYTITKQMKPSSLKEITGFSFTQKNNPNLTQDAVGTIEDTDIKISVPFGTSLASLIPSISLSGKSISPMSGIAQNFSTPQTYTVTAEDKTTRAYKVSIVVLPQLFYSVSFNSTGGGNTPTAQTIPSGEVAIYPSAVPTKSDSLFAGWYSDLASNKTFDFTTKITKDVTLYAKWTVKIYAVAFNTNSDSKVDTQFVAINAKAIKPTSVTKKDSVLENWYSDAALTKVFDFEMPIMSDTVIYAKWRFHKYIVNFHVDGLSSINTVYVDMLSGDITEPSIDPTKKDYGFIGWYSDEGTLSTKFDFTKTITSDTNIYAKWHAGPYVISSDGVLSRIPSEEIVEVPRSINGIKVTSIKKIDATLENVFGTRLPDFNTTVKEIIIPDHVTTLMDACFSRSSGLLKVSLPKNLVTLGDKIFFLCYYLVSIELPEGLNSIGNQAFYNCRSITRFVLPPNVALGEYCFQYCFLLKEINIPPGTTNIPAGTFYNCTSLTSIDIPSNVTYIGKEVFYNCTSLTSINIPSGVTYIGKEAFYYCTSLTSIDIPSNVTYIGSSAFSYCAFADVILPEGLTSIGEYVFSNCRNLKNVNIPIRITTLPRGLFYNCSSMTDFSVPEHVTKIEGHAFYNCRNLKNISLPQNLTSIGDNAFQDCVSLANVSLPESLTSIGYHGFLGCSSLKNVSIPQSLTSFGFFAFGECTQFTEIILPAKISLNNISFSEVFLGCSELKKIVLNFPGIVPMSRSMPEDYVFTNFQNVTEIFVHPDFIEAYKTTKYWSLFANKIKPIVL